MFVCLYCCFCVGGCQDPSDLYSERYACAVRAAVDRSVLRGPPAERARLYHRRQPQGALHADH